MSKSFSQRIGAVPETKVMQTEAMDEELRNRLWSLMTIFVWENYPSEYYNSVKHSSYYPFLARLFMYHYKKPIDEISGYWPNVLKQARAHFMGSDWHVALSFLEFISEQNPCKDKADFVKACNDALEIENSAYRFIGGRLTEIQSKEEIEDIENALRNGGKYQGVKLHLETALKLMTDKQNPDPRNSMKESISAVEALAKHLTKLPSASLGEALTELERRHDLDPVLKKAMSTLYGYTNNSDGIRHAALNDKSSLTKTDARFMMIVCSAFINYAIDKYEA